MLSEGSMQEQLSKKLGDLSPQLKRAAQFMLDNPDEVATQSLRHVAKQADLPPPTFSRLARAVGCETYNDLRDLCRDEYRARSSRFADRALELLRSGSGDRSASETLLVAHAAASVAGIQTLLERIDATRLEQAAERMVSARRVALIGSLSAAAFVEYAGYVAGMAMRKWSVFGRNGSSLASQIMDLGPEDAALVIAIDPYARRSVRAARLVREQGSYLLAITDNASSPLAELADESFFVSSDSPQFFPSHVAVLVLLETLIGLAVRSKGIESQQRIAAVERHSLVLGEYWRDESAA